MILLSFDIEEFDYPEELGLSISDERKIEVSSQGLLRILELLDKYHVTATFFCTAFFAEKAPQLISQIAKGGHEIASHGYHHSDFKTEDLRLSREVLEQISGRPVMGYRMARMQAVNPEEIAKAGYLYDSSLNPFFLPGRYNNFGKPRTVHRVADVQKDLWEIPASVSPWLRLPMFWLALHHYPLCLYKFLASRILKRDGYLLTYFHPWEFADITGLPEGKLPYIVTHNSGKKEAERLEKLIVWCQKRGEQIGTIQEFLANHRL